MSSEVLLALFRPHQGIRVRVRGGGDEYRLKKSVLRITRSWGMPRRDLQSSYCAVSIGQELTESQEDMGSRCPVIGIL